MEMGPRLANCPREHSMKNKGKPANANISVYGIRKAPEQRTRKKQKTMNLSVFTVFFMTTLPRLKYLLWLFCFLQNIEIDM